MDENTETQRVYAHEPHSCLCSTGWALRLPQACCSVYYGVRFTGFNYLN